jgi:2-dehydro-3-deoxygluconokinase
MSTPTSPPSAPAFDVTTIGEVMLRLSVPVGRRLEAAETLDLHPGGSEGNTVTILSRLGRRCAWISSLPGNALGRRASNALRAAGVALDGVVWRSQGKMGVYYLEFSTPPRPTQAIYDRAGSCAAQLRPEDVDWAHLLNTRILHLTGITPALSVSCLEVTREAMARARAAGVPVSFDVNYRQLLWSAEEAATALLPLMQGVDLLLCSQRDAQRLFGCSGTAEDIVQGMLDRSHARQVAITLGAEGVIAWDGAKLLREPALPVVIIDRLGAGDALSAGLLHGWLDGNLAQGLRYGVTLAALALSQHGDFLIVSKEELESLLATVGRDLVR